MAEGQGTIWWRAPRTRTERLAGLAACLMLCYGASALGAVATGRSVATWYQALTKPGFTPPDWVFAPVWSALYTMMAIALWLVWRRRGLAGAKAAVALFVVQLVLNVIWTWLFFAYRLLDWATFEIALLLLAIAAAIRAFHRIDLIAALLLLPYAAWVTYAGLLTIAIWRLNLPAG